MRLFSLLLILFPLTAWADLSVIEFRIGDEGRYRLLLEESGEEDVLEWRGSGGPPVVVFKGRIDSLELPRFSVIERTYGPRAVAGAGFVVGDYHIEGSWSAGLRIRSGDQLAVVLEHGTVLLPWPGLVEQVAVLDTVGDQVSGLSFTIVSVRGQKSSGTYLILSDELSYAHPLTQTFTDELQDARIRDGKIVIEKLSRTWDPAAMRATAAFELNRRRSIRGVALGNLFRLPGGLMTDDGDLTTEHRFLPFATTYTYDERMESFVEELDQREYSPDTKAVKTEYMRATRFLILKEFPRLQELMKKDRILMNHVELVVISLAEMWRMERVKSEIIRAIINKRLEAEIPDRTKCELALMKFRGEGSHKLGYLRSSARNALNAIHRRMWVKPKRK